MLNFLLIFKRILNKLCKNNSLSSDYRLWFNQNKIYEEIPMTYPRASDSSYKVTLPEMKTPAGIETEADLLIALLNGVLYSIAKLSEKDPDEISEKEIGKLEKRLEILFQALKKGIGKQDVSSDDLLDHIIA